MLCCTAAVPGTTSCCSTGWHRRRLPAVARSPARSPAVARPLSFARRCSIVRRRSGRQYCHVPLLLHQRCVHMHTILYIVESQCVHPQLSSSPTIRHSCLALRYGAESCCAVLSFEHTAATGMMQSIRYHVPLCTYVRVVYSCFCFLDSVHCHLSVPMYVPPPR